MSNIYLPTKIAFGKKIIKETCDGNEIFSVNK